jgi:hypothetical protein
MVCPRCHDKDIGRIGVRRYYCSNCCCEFKEKPDAVILYRLLEDGKYQQVRAIDKKATYE